MKCVRNSGSEILAISVFNGFPLKLSGSSNLLMLFSAITPVSDAMLISINEPLTKSNVLNCINPLLVYVKFVVSLLSTFTSISYPLTFVASVFGNPPQK